MAQRKNGSDRAPDHFQYSAGNEKTAGPGGKSQI